MDWDESGAFPKMQLGVMDDLLEVAEEELRDDMGVVEMDEGEGPGRTSSLMWKCGGALRLVLQEAGDLPHHRVWIGEPLRS